MSRLKQLINELCPDGVEYKTLGEIGTLIRGNGLQKSDFVEKGVGCIHYGQIYTYYKTFTDKIISFVSPELAIKLKKVNTGDLIITITSENVEDVCKCVAWLGKEEIVTGGHAAIFKHKQNPKYLAYYFQTEDFFIQKRKIATGTKVIEISPSKLEKVKIPVPPLEVQKEIVRLLDNFTELTAELTAELEKRKRQYEYYRDLLLTFDNDINISDKSDIKKLIKELCPDGVEFVEINTVIKSLKTGLNPRKNFLLNTSDAKNFYVTVRELNGRDIKISEKTDKVNDEALKLINNRSNLEKNDVLFSGTGTIGRTALVEKEPTNWNIKEGVYVIKPDLSKINPMYLIYVLNSSLLKQIYKNKAMGSTVESISMNDFKRIKIPVPPLKVQNKIVEILDRFNTLANSITCGLPAEIEARKKQYEYYRDKLLSFKKNRGLNSYAL